MVDRVSERHFHLEKCWKESVPMVQIDLGQNQLERLILPQAVSYPLILEQLVVACKILSRTVYLETKDTPFIRHYPSPVEVYVNVS